MFHLTQYWLVIVFIDQHWLLTTDFKELYVCVLLPKSIEIIKAILFSYNSSLYKYKDSYAFQSNNV